MSNAHRNSKEQQAAEPVILDALKSRLLSQENLNVSFENAPSEWKIQLDGYCANPAILVEVWAHIGVPIGAQSDKVLKDCCKLLYAEKLAGQECRKIIAVGCTQAIGFLQGKSLS